MFGFSESNTELLNLELKTLSGNCKTNPDFFLFIFLVRKVIPGLAVWTGLGAPSLYLVMEDLVVCNM